jgi:hypothetical protein
MLPPLHLHTVGPNILECFGRTIVSGNAIIVEAVATRSLRRTAAFALRQRQTVFVKLGSENVNVNIHICDL